MNLLAKHYFDFQSFVNLPHKAVQLHKMPPSQAGIDPSAAWAPKSMKVAGKNRPAPAARANRNNAGAKNGEGGRYGIPTKLEFRNWGDKHGELHSEKIVPYKDGTWMAPLEGDFKHFHEQAEHAEPAKSHAQAEGASALPFSLQQLFPWRMEIFPEQSSWDHIELLAILTLAHPPNASEFLTVTIKAIKGVKVEEKPFVKLFLYEGINLLDRRIGGKPMLPQSSNTPSSGISSSESSLTRSQRWEPEYSLHGGAVSRSRLNLYPNHNGGPAGVIHLFAEQSRSGAAWRDGRLALLQKGKQGRGKIGQSSSDGSLEQRQSYVGESFLFMLSAERIKRCHLLVEVYVTRDVDNQERKIGCCVLGDLGVGYRPLDPVATALGKGAQHWQRMLQYPGRPVYAWHRSLLSFSSNLHPVVAEVEPEERSTHQHGCSSSSGGRPAEMELLDENRHFSGVPAILSASLPSIVCML